MPPSRLSAGTKLGLLAFGVVGAAALLAGAAALAYHRPGGGAAVFLGSGGGADDKRDRLLAEVAAHPFWKVKVTEGQVAELVERVRACQSDTLVYVDDRFTVKIAPGMESWACEHFREMRLSQRWDDLPGERYAMLDLHRYQGRPSEQQVLRDLKADMGWAEFHPAPQSPKLADPFAPLLDEQGRPVPLQGRSSTPPAGLRNPRGPRP